MTSEEPNTNSTPDLFGEGPGQSGGIASNSARHDVPKEGPGNQSGGIFGSSVQRGTAVKRKLSNYTIDTKYEAVMAVETKKATKSMIAADFGVTLNTLSTWLKKADESKRPTTQATLVPKEKKQNGLIPRS